jgi:hypothetical protein
MNGITAMDWIEATLLFRERKELTTTAEIAAVKAVTMTTIAIVVLGRLALAKEPVETEGGGSTVVGPVPRPTPAFV